MNPAGMKLYGRKSVRERLIAHPASVRTLWVREGSDVADIERLAEARGIARAVLPARRFERLVRFKNVQGVIADVDSFAYAEWDQVLALWAREQRSLLVVERLNDPHNLGVMLRGAACFGDCAVLISAQAACGVTETVAHVAAGGENYVPVCRLDDVAAALRQARECGYWIMALSPRPEAESLIQTRLRFPLACVLGPEHGTLSAAVSSCADAVVTIPMRGAPLSLNVNNVWAILGYEITRQKNNSTARR